MTISKLILALISCALSSAFFMFYQASTVFMANGLNQQSDPSRLEAFIATSRITTGFWQRIFEGWFFLFSIAFVACFMFMVLSLVLIPNKTNQSNAKKERAHA